MKKIPTAQLLLILLAISLLLPACKNRASERGVEWRHPDELKLPYAFEPTANVPRYARAWRMPEGFQGFPERWNARVREYLQEAVEQQKAEFTHAATRLLLSLPGTRKHTTAKVRAEAALHELSILAQRLNKGDYLVFLRPRDLPDDLEWQDGQNEPELGSPNARKGGSIRLALQRSFPNTLRPFGPNSNNSTRRYIYDDIDLPLTRLHPGTGNIIPGTADRWAVSQDGKTVYFHIDENARFSDGCPLTARDFITSLFICTSPHAVEPFFTDFYLGNFSRIAVYDNHTIAVSLPTKKLYAPFYAAIPASCTPFYAEFGPDYPTRYQWRVRPTTGGYTVDPTRIVFGRTLTMNRVRNWWAANRKYTRYSCNVDSIVYSFYSDASKINELFRIGEIDILNTRDVDLWYEGLEIDPVHRGYIQRVHFNNTWPRNCFGFHLNASRAPFDDINFRRGFHHALNIQAVIDTIFRGDYRHMGSYFSGFGQYTDDTVTARPFSPEKAREYFAKAGYRYEGGDGILHKKDGSRLQVNVSSRIDPLYANCMNMLREDAARCGLDLKLTQMDDTVFYLKVKDKQYDAAIFSWGFSPPLPDPAPFFLSKYAVQTDGAPVKGSSNITATAYPQLDRAIIAAKRADTETAAIAAHHRIQKIIAATAAWVPGWSTTYWRFAQWRWVSWPDTPECRFCPPRYYDPLDSHLYWIDEQEKKAVLKARTEGKSFEEKDIVIPLPENTP